MHARTKNLLAILFFCCSLIAECQEVEFSSTWGARFDVEKPLHRARIVGFSPAGIYVVKERPNNAQVAVPYSIHRIDPRDYHLAAKLLLNIKDGKVKHEPEYVIMTKSRLLLFCSNDDHRESRLMLHARELDKETMDPGRLRKVADVRVNGKSGVGKTRFEAQMSYDSSKILFARNISTRGDSLDRYWFLVIGNDGDLIWDKVVTLPTKPGRFKIESIRVSNNGNGYVLGKVDEVFSLFTIQHKGDSITNYPVQLGGLYLSSVRIETRGDDDLMLAAFYSPYKGANALGVYFINLDVKAGQLKAKSLTEFDPKFILQNLSKQDYRWTLSRADVGEKAELFQCSLDRILINEDGSAILIGEQHYRYANQQNYYSVGGGNYPQITTTNRAAAPFTSNQRTANVQPASPLSSGRLSTPQPYQLYNNAPNALKNYHYVHNDIVIVKVTNQGQIQWTRKIYKSQDTVDDNGFFSSYLPSIVNGNLLVLFNDNPRNNNLNPLERPVDFSGSKPNLVLVSFDSQGEQTRQVLRTYGDDDMPFVPKMSEQVSGHDLILFSQRKVNQQLAGVRFK